MIVVTGKGGTGKSTVAAAIALAASKRGKKVLVCEVGARERMCELFGRPPGGTEASQIRELQKNLYSVHVQPDQAMREYGIMTLKSETLYNLVFERKVVRYFLKAAPSLAEIVMLGKITWHAEKEMERGKHRWDLVVLDAPATGHALALLTVPRVLLSLVSEGPLAHDMTWMQALLQNPAETQVVVTALPEEMPVNEAIELRTKLKAEKLPLGPTILNSVFTPRFSETERRAVSQGGPLLAAVADAADSHEARAQMSVQYEKALRDAIGEPAVLVPQLFDRTFGLNAVEQVAAALEGVL
jgi:anion-transporting  ArsA/GET3 family ATPase